MCQHLRIRQIFTFAYPPRFNVDERTHRQMRFQLSSLVEKQHQNWDVYVPVIMAAMRDSPCESTGCTPNSLTYGREIRLPYAAATSVELPESIETDWLSDLEE